MNKKEIIILCGCIILSFAILITLYSFSPLSKEIYRASFIRSFIDKERIIERGLMNIEFNSFYIAGYTKNKVYLGNSTAPFHLLIVNRSLTDSQHVNLKIKLDSIMEPRRFRLTVDSPNFYLSHGVQPVILRGNISKWEAVPFIRDSSYYFVESIPTGASSFVLKSYSNSSKGYELAKKTIDSFEFHESLLERQIDGMFCVDGKLHYDRSINKVVYLHFYRNQFIVTDTNLNLAYRHHTIDTFSRARIKIAKIEEGNQTMLSAPPMQTNRSSSVHQNRLYIQSGLMAKNENIEDFKNGSVIDVYDITTGQYLKSFYLPNYNGKRISEFITIDGSILALYERSIVKFTIPKV